MDIKAIYAAIKQGNFEELHTEEEKLDVNSKDINGYTLLHFAAQSNDTEFAKELIKEGVIYNSKTAEGKTPLNIANGVQIKELLNAVRMFFKGVKKGKRHKLSAYITEENSLVNVKEEGGYSALYWAISKGHEDIVELLLESGANVSDITDIGYTTLHAVAAKGSTKIAELLLQRISAEKCFGFINSQTYETKSSCLHISAESGNFDIVSFLLKRGAVYNIENKTGSTPYELSGDNRVKDILKLTDNVFSYANNMDSNLFTELSNLSSDLLEVVTNARNVSQNTILQELIANDRKDSAKRLLVILDKNLVTPLWKLRGYEDLKHHASNHLRCSETYMPMLEKYAFQNVSAIHSAPCHTLKEGSYYLSNAEALFKGYKKIRPGLIEDENMKLAIDTFVELQFDSSLMCFDYKNYACKGKPICYVSKAQGTEYYYRLLHSEFRNDIQLFVDMGKCRIDTPVNKFLKSMEEKISLIYSYQLMKAIKDNNECGVIECLEKGGYVNFLDQEKETPLVYAVKFGSVKILQTLLERGADVQHKVYDENTVLHIAISSNSQLYSRNVETPVNTHEVNPALEQIKSLLNYGAIYNSKNKKGETPINLSRSPEASTLIQTVDTCFQKAENDDPDLIYMLQTIDHDSFAAVTRSRDNNGCTLLQVAIASGHKDIENEILEVMKRSLRNDAVDEPDGIFQEKLRKCIDLAEEHLKFSEIYLPVLRVLSKPDISEINTCPWKTLMEGSYYLCNAYNLVHEYKKFNILPENPCIEKVNCMLKEFQFDPKHISLSSNDANQVLEVPFRSCAQGTEYYYKLLSSNKKNVRRFIELSEQCIDIPVKEFFDVAWMQYFNRKQCTIL